MANEKEQKQQQEQQQPALQLTAVEQDVVACLQRSIKKTFSVMARTPVPGEATITKKKIIQWMGRFNVIKPHGYLYTSVMRYRYGAKKDLLNCNGIMVIFYPDNVAEIIVKMLQLEKKPTEDDILDACGEFCNVVSGSFKVELAKMGYNELDLGLPVSFVGEVDELFEYKGKEEVEVTYYDENNEPFVRVVFACDEATIFNEDKLLKKEAKK